MRQLVLVGIDPGYRDVAALQWAVEWATATSQELLVVSGFQIGQAEVPPDFHDGMLEEAKRMIEAKLDFVEGTQHANTHSRLIEGDPVQVVVDVVRSEDPSLVVLGSKGGGGYDQLAVDGVGHRILSELTRPVSVVRHMGGPIRSSHIVVGFDGTEVDGHALAWAMDAGRRTSSRVTVLRESGDRDEEAIREDTRLISDLAEGSVDVELRIGGDEHVKELCELGDEREASMIVAGSKGAGRLLELLTGDEGATLVEKAGRPVVIIHQV